MTITRSTVVQALNGNMEVFSKLFESEISGLKLIEAFELAKNLQKAANATSMALQNINQE
jgi:hypothetical protein